MKHTKKKRLSLHWRYLVATGLLFAVEVGIALYVRDNFVRPYLGDVLVVILIYCGLRSIGIQHRWLPGFVFAFALTIEILQYFHLVDVWQIHHPVLRVILGSTFDLHDIFCYLVGAIILFAWQKIEN